MFRTITTLAAVGVATAAAVIAPGAIAHADDPIEPTARPVLTVEQPEPIATMIPGSYMFHVIERYCLDLPRPDACH